MFFNNDSTVISLIKKDEFYGEQSKIFVKQNFGGSLPKFVAAFTSRSKLSKKEIQELQKLDGHKED